MSWPPLVLALSLAGVALFALWRRAEEEAERNLRRARFWRDAFERLADSTEWKEP